MQPPDSTNDVNTTLTVKDTGNFKLYFELSDDSNYDLFDEIRYVTIFML